MKITFVASLLLITLISLPVFSQETNEKGVDTQTKAIRDQASQTKQRGRHGRSINFGSGKTVVRERLPNPMRITSRRDILVKNINFVLGDEKFIVDEQASRFERGIVVTKPKVFARGPITTKNELYRYARVPNTNQIWTRGRYFLTIDVTSLDGIKNKVSVVATVEGRSENGLFSEWSTLESSGQAEEEFLVKLSEFLGISTTDSKARKP